MIDLKSKIERKPLRLNFKIGWSELLWIVQIAFLLWVNPFAEAAPPLSCFPALALLLILGSAVIVDEKKVRQVQTSLMLASFSGCITYLFDFNVTPLASALDTLGVLGMFLVCFFINAVWFLMLRDKTFKQQFSLPNRKNKPVLDAWFYIKQAPRKKPSPFISKYCFPAFISLFVGFELANYFHQLPFPYIGILMGLEVFMIGFLFLMFYYLHFLIAFPHYFIYREIEKQNNSHLINTEKGVNLWF